MVTGFSRGHAIWFDEVSWSWRFTDTGELLTDTRPCAECGVIPEPNGPDPCIGWLPGVRAACCGHGGRSEAYVMEDRKRMNEGLLMLLVFVLGFPLAVRCAVVLVEWADRVRLWAERQR